MTAPSAQSSGDTWSSSQAWMAHDSVAWAVSSRAMVAIAAATSGSAAWSAWKQASSAP